MKPGTLIAVLLLTACSLVGAVYMGRYAVGTPVAGSAAPRTADADALPVSATGPWPKVEVDEPVHEFDVIAVGESGKHPFEIRNEGAAVLQLKFLRSTCKCTFSDMGQDEVREVAPGSSTTVTLEWTPKDPEPSFRQQATIATNDPKLRVLEIGVMGRVEPLVTIGPEGTWDAGTIGEDGTAKVKGRIYSAIRDAFSLEVASSAENLTAESRPLTADELSDMDAKSGYEVTASLTQPEGQDVGTVKGTLTLTADVEGARSFPVSVEARIPLPVTLRPVSPSVEWVPNSTAILFPERFPAAGGAEAKFHLVANQMGGEPFRVTVAEASPAFLEASVEPRDVDAQGNGSYTLTVRIPAGQRPMTRIGRDVGRLTLKTNHPKLAEFPLKVSFKSY